MVSLPLYLQGRKEDELPYHGPPRKLAKHTSSEQCFELTRGFIADCVNNHPRCRRTIRGSREDGRPDGPYLPRRLLRIPQPNRKKTGVIVRLVETASIEAETKKGMKYASLSYCWGNANVHKPFLLTKATHAALVAGVDVSLLPRTIQHAILATAWLGLEWLWVDSLCIVQDCSQDWAEQAPLMMSVYNEAFVTLAAVAAKGSDDGLFAERDPRTYLECPVFRDDAMNTTFTMPPRCKKGKMWDDWDWPLWDRGWVLQERVMARRTIKFGAFLGWDCCKMERDEFDYRKTMEVYRYRSAKPPLCARLATLTQRLPPPAQAADASEMYNFWIDVLTEYTSAKLTVRTDRLVAISGIIEAIHQETGWENVAGIWLPFIHLDLCWKRAPDRYKSRLSQWPTWSWASVE
ncbi:heterokaryon incompatibility protein-domain-containing protein, partial [Podospora aff. communis PSN243]